MSEELLQRNLIENPPRFKHWHFYNIGATNLNTLKRYGIIPNVAYGDFGKRKPDGLIALNQNVIATIENKQPKNFNTKKKRDKAIDQSIGVANVLNSDILIVTDTINTLWINPKTGDGILDEHGNPITTPFDSNNSLVGDLIKTILSSIDEKNSKIIPLKQKDPTSLAKQIWQDIWSVSGATPENCLYTFVEIFIFKYLSDLNVLTGFYNFYDLIKKYESNTEEEVLEFYADTIRKEIKQKFKTNPKDGTTIINGTIFVSKDEKAVRGYSGVFRKILDKFKDEGKLENIHHDFKSKLFESFLKESISKKNWGQYFTPLKVVRAIIEMVEIREGMSICDPACGVGKFLLEPILKDIKRYFPVKKGQITPKIQLYGFDKGFDHDEQKTIILAKANMLIYFSDLLRKHPSLSDQFSDLFNDTFLLKTNSILGSLSDPAKDKYDLILTNPPYVTSGSSNIKEEIVKCGLDKHFTVNSLGVEGLFLEWIVRALKPGGKAVIVVPDGIFIRKYDKDMRSFLLTECNIDAIISLPVKTFFTTNKKTYILALTKKLDKSIKQTDPIMTYLVSEIGETLDINRFESDENHLEAAINLYNQFKGSKQHFISNDKRCKIVDPDMFYDEAGNGWLIDNFWSKEERVKLGIIEEDHLVTLDEFSALIGEVSNTLVEYQEQLSLLSQKKREAVAHNSLPISDIFEPSLGNPKYTRKFINNNKGKYPVYSASNHGPLGYMNFFDYEQDCMSWVRNGFAGHLEIHSGKFSINYDRGILIPKNKNLYLPYIKMILEPVLRNIARGRKTLDGKDEFTKVYLSTMGEIEIPLPIDSNGDISYQLQVELFKDLQIGTFLKNDIDKHIQGITSLKVDINEEMKQHQEKTVVDLFECIKGKSLYTQKYIKEHPGVFPVYSSQTTDSGIMGSIDSYDHEGRYITWTTDGAHAGTPFLRDGKFSMTTHCGALGLVDEFKEVVNLEYVYFYLKSRLKSFARGEQNKRVTITVVEKIPVLLPIDKKGGIDIQKQHEIVTKMKTVEEIRSGIISRLNALRTNNIKY